MIISYEIFNVLLQNMGTILHVLFHWVKDEFTSYSNRVQCVIKHWNDIMVQEFMGQRQIRLNGLRFPVAEIQ